MRVEELRRLAEANGVSSRFRLANGRWNRVRPETLEAVLAAMGVEPGVPATGGADPGAPATPSGAPVLVARRGREAGWALPAGSLLVLESGEERAPPARLPGDLPLGRHRLVHPGGERRLVVAPEACHLPDRLAGGGPPPPTWRSSRASARSSGSAPAIGTPGRPSCAIPAPWPWPPGARPTPARSVTTPTCSGCSTSSCEPRRGGLVAPGGPASSTTWRSGSTPAGSTPGGCGTCWPRA